MDLPAISKNFIADIKTTEFKVDGSGNTWKNGKKTNLFYDEHLIQLCGYALGCGTFCNDKGEITYPYTLINIYVSTLEDSIYVKEWSSKEIEYGTEIFKLLLLLWWIKNG